MNLTLWCIVFAYYQNIVCQDSIGRVYIDRYCGLSKNKLCVFNILCPTEFLVVYECLSNLVGTGGVLDVGLWLCCGGVSGGKVWGLDQGLEGWGY